MTARKAHERERNSSRKVEEYQRNDEGETNLKETQALAAATETKTKELEHKKSDAEEQTTRLHDHCHKLKDHDDLTESLQNEKDSHLLRSTDLKHELVWKCKDPQELKSHT